MIKLYVLLLEWRCSTMIILALLFQYQLVIFRAITFQPLLFTLCSGILLLFVSLYVWLQTLFQHFGWVHFKHLASVLPPCHLFAPSCSDPGSEGSPDTVRSMSPGTSSHSLEPMSGSKTKVHRSLPQKGVLQNQPKNYVTSYYVPLFSFPKLL